MTHLLLELLERWAAGIVTQHLCCYGVVVVFLL